MVYRYEEDEIEGSINNEFYTISKRTRSSRPSSVLMGHVILNRVPEAACTNTFGPGNFSVLGRHTWKTSEPKEVIKGAFGAHDFTFEDLACSSNRLPSLGLQNDADKVLLISNPFRLDLVGLKRSGIACKSLFIWIEGMELIYHTRSTAVSRPSVKLLPPYQTASSPTLSSPYYKDDTSGYSNPSSPSQPAPSHPPHSTALERQT